MASATIEIHSVVWEQIERAGFHRDSLLGVIIVEMIHQPGGLVVRDSIVGLGDAPKALVAAVLAIRERSGR